MLMPFLRLVLIYALLVGAVVAVVHRDRLVPLLTDARDRVVGITTPSQDPPRAQTPAPDPQPAVPLNAQATIAAPPAADPVFPDPDRLSATPPAANTTAPQPATPGSPAPLGTPVAAPAAPSATPAQPTAPPPQTAQATDALAAGIADARAAYWSGDIAGARTAMLALSEAHPDNPDVAGELGNLAFALRDYPAAAEAWARAGQLLIDRGEGARVRAFLPILQSIAPEQAAALAARRAGE